ncbi:hypothetical protein SLS58_010888 [Diplodia intermedia]|uniref:Heterokaryon incompatibility domain-containing protein n=1 Tax=Diplodia intermedia TaxID=856260 RepID=A0ABR3T2Z5_9PEZI
MKSSSCREGSGVEESEPDIAAVEPRKINFESLKQKLDLCLNKHGSHCAGNGDDEIVPGMYAINCRTRRIEPFNHQQAYVALSYVWGQSGSPAPDGIPLMQLPSKVERTIEDAMVATLSMGYVYLWVDKYCIDQGDVDGKMDQIRRMDSIYKNAAFTIVAAVGADADYGLPGVETRFGTRFRVPRLHCRIGNMLVCCRSAFRKSADMGMDRYRYPQNELLRESKWNTRGWTYQEGLLARRCLVFTDEQSYGSLRRGAVGTLYYTSVSRMGAINNNDP